MYYANETDPVTINFCDFSDAAVAFQQHLSTWSGEIGTFATCVQTFLKDNPKYESCDPPGPYDKELERQLNGMDIEPELFNTVWQHMPKKPRIHNTGLIHRTWTGFYYRPSSKQQHYIPLAK